MKENLEKVSVELAVFETLDDICKRASITVEVTNSKNGISASFSPVGRYESVIQRVPPQSCCHSKYVEEQPSQNKPETAKHIRNPWGDKSYAEMIEQAIRESPQQHLTLAEIYEWFTKNIPYFRERSRDRPSGTGWKNSVRHNLSLHQRFMKLQNKLGKPSLWTMDLSYLSRRLPGQSDRKRRSNRTSKADAVPEAVVAEPQKQSPVPPEPISLAENARLGTKYTDSNLLLQQNYHFLEYLQRHNAQLSN